MAALKRNIHVCNICGADEKSVNLVCIVNDDWRKNETICVGCHADRLESLDAVVHARMIAYNREKDTRTEMQKNMSQWRLINAEILINKFLSDRELTVAELYQEGIS